MPAWLSDKQQRKAAFGIFVPIAAFIIWKWLEPLGHSRRLDVLFGVVLGGVMLKIVWQDGLPTLQQAGLTPPFKRHAVAALHSVAAVLPLVAAVIAWAWLTDRLYGSLALLRALAFYPFGALVQEGIVFIYLLPRAEILWGPRGGLFATALLFGMLHLPNPLLTIGSLIMVLILARSWQRDRSLIALALAHGILGAVCDKAVHVSMRIGVSWFH
jgi:membrane protease YdiL (CAAX protease family)